MDAGSSNRESPFDRNSRSFLCLEANVYDKQHTTVQCLATMHDNSSFKSNRLRDLRRGKCFENCYVLFSYVAILAMFQQFVMQKTICYLFTGQARTQQYVSGAAPSFFMGGDQYIIGGSDAAPGEFPWVLSLIRGGSHSCGASLLSSTKGLTASQCVDGA